MPFVRLVALAQLGAAAVEGVVVLLLVAQAAEQAPADAGDLGGVEEEVLLLGHLDGHGGEPVQEAPAAADHAAVAQRADHLRLVAHAYLAQLDARVVFVDEVLDQLPEIDASRRREVEDHLGVPVLFHHIKL